MAATRPFIFPFLVALFIACAPESAATPLPGGTPTSSIAATPTPTPGGGDRPATFTPPLSPGVSTTPTPITTPAPTPGAPPPLALAEAEWRGLTQAGIRAALEDLQRLSGAEETRQSQIVRAEQVTWRDGSLGCPEPGKFYTQALAPGFWLVFAHQGQEFDYRIAGSQALLCTQQQRTEPLERQPLTGLWSRLAPLPTSRSEVAVAELNGKIYVLGGFGPGATANEEYDPLTNSWRPRAPIPQGLDHAAAVAVGGRIYLIGGFDSQLRPVNKVYAYDPQTDTWSQRAALPTRRGALAAGVVDGKIYAIGGRTAEDDVATTEEYDPASDNWRPRAPMPTRRDHIALSVVKGKIYVIGGRLGGFDRNLADNEEYDPRTDTWVKKAPLPTPRSGIAAAVVDDKIYVFGGEAVEGTFNTNERYDPDSDAWVAMPPLPTARHGLGAAALGNRIYVLAGGATPGGSDSAHNEVFIVRR